MPSKQYTVFYSWQTDLSSSTNRGFIQTALERAAKTIRDDDSVRVEPVIDRDTAGVAGSPDISSTIFNKIDSADVFVCDVSIINKGSDKRPTPNPNVLLELGYALKVQTTKRIIMVLNTAYGGPEQLPFDLRTKRVTPYFMPEEETDRASARKALEKTLEDALRVILSEQDIDPPGVVVQPTPLSDQVVAAIESNSPRQTALVRRYMTWLSGEIAALNPAYPEKDRNEWDELFLETVAQATPLVAEFARVADQIALSNANEAAEALFDGFSGILGQYTFPNEYSGTVEQWRFDLARFIGHELFITLVALLMREQRWDILAALLEQQVFVSNGPSYRPSTVGYGYIYQYVSLLEHRKQRLRLNVGSVWALVRNERHTQGELARIVPMDEFIAADCLLFLRDRLQSTNPPTHMDWWPVTIVYAKLPPRILIEATSKKVAERLLQVFGVPNMPFLRSRYQERVINSDLNPGFPFFHNPLKAMDPTQLGSK